MEQGQATRQQMAMFQALPSSALAEGQRIHREAFGRRLTFLRHNGAVVCMDRFCGHMGGPLGDTGAIEDIGGMSCIKCPWHGRVFDMGSGCHISMGDNGLCSSADVQQRVHRTIESKDGHIWVQLTAGSGAASDNYNLVPASPPEQQRSEMGAFQQSARMAGSRGQGFGIGDPGAAGNSGFTAQQASGTRATSPPQPLTPFAGVERRPLPPSPMKQPYQPISRTYQHQKLSAAHIPGMRNGAARGAILKHHYEPPLKQAAAPAPAQAPRQMVQSKLFFPPVQQEQQQQPPFPGQLLAMEMDF